MKTQKHNWKESEDWADGFAKEWEGASREDAEKADFIRAFLHVFGHPKKRGIGEFEKPVRYPDGSIGKIDFYWKDRIAIEMKSKGKKLSDAWKQLSGYMATLPESEIPNLWMVSDFATIQVYHRNARQERTLKGMEALEADQETIISFNINKLRKHLKHFSALTNDPQPPPPADKESVNTAAALRMASLHDALVGYGYSGHQLEVYLARLLFCLFANDTGIFEQNSFQKYIINSDPTAKDLDARITRLFRDLNKEIDERIRNPFLSEGIDHSHFKYINGNLFSDDLDNAAFDRKMRDTLLECLKFDWSQISPAIFGSMFQGVMEKAKRRELGAHYTSEENILKVINPLFMDDLRSEFKKVKYNNEALAAFQTKLGRLKFLDPACGCGNFLIIAYRELRRLEIEVLHIMLTGKEEYMLPMDITGNVKVNVNQFYGIEIEEWPCQIARTGMWLMDHLMNMEARDVLGHYVVRLPLKQSATVVHDNALRIDWESVVPKGRLSYILGNPPFGGATISPKKSLTKKEQEEQKRKKEDMKIVFGTMKGAGNLDYVTAWFKRSSDYMAGNKAIIVGFVATNSITQGQQVSALWKQKNKKGIYINFAVPTFKWKNEAKGKAAVHCVIIGFSYNKIEPVINPYLTETPMALVKSRSKPLCNVPEMQKGNIPVDGGNLIIESVNIKEFLKNEPQAAKYVRKLLGADEFLNNKERFCLWLVDASPVDLRKMPLIMERIEKCRAFRLASPKAATRRFADQPSLFMEIRQPKSRYILVPRHSSEKRHYIPFGFIDADVITTDANSTIAGASLYHFGILTSNVHMAWAKAVCGRLEMRYRYSNDIVYNNFPWPDATNKQKAEIEKLAQCILDARAKFPESPLSILYDPLTMPPELLRAHQALDNTVMKLYGYKKNTSESAITNDLMKRYQSSLEKEEIKPKRKKKI
jgi:type I restriction-modification system DNA methylase subunit